MQEKTEFHLDHQAGAASEVGNKLPYSSPELRIYGDVYERTNTSLPFTFQDTFVLNHTT